MLNEASDAWAKNYFLKANFEIEGESLCCNDHYGNRLLTIPLGVKGFEHPITKLVIAKINSPIVLIPTTSKARLIFAELVLERFISSLLWVLYYQTKAFRRTVLTDYSWVQAHQSLGSIYDAELNLCFACLDFWDSNKLGNLSSDSSALDSWERLMGEHLCDALNSHELRRSKEDDEKDIQYLLECLDSLVNNPYSPNESPHHFNLVESAFTIARSQSTDNVPMRKARKKFREGAWKKYKDSWGPYKQAIHSGGGLKKVHIDGDELYVQMTRRTRLCLTSPNFVQKFLPQIGGV